LTNRNLSTRFVEIKRNTGGILDMKIWHDYIKAIDPNIDPEKVLDVADDCFRIFGEMSHAEWLFCVKEAGGKVPA